VFSLPTSRLLDSYNASEASVVSRELAMGSV